MIILRAGGCISADIIKLPFQGAYRIIPFYTQGVALGWDIPGFQPGKTSGFSLQIKIKRAGTDSHTPVRFIPGRERIYSGREQDDTQSPIDF
ncbi:MAG: hypothetical protein LBS88_08490 [Tannerellaceae bacterium]|nr:hypothetical protein [Tannerellaceae bacterium]